MPKSNDLHLHSCMSIACLWYPHFIPSHTEYIFRICPFGKLEIQTGNYNSGWSVFGGGGGGLYARYRLDKPERYMVDYIDLPTTLERRKQ